MILIEYVLFTALITTALWALYSALLRWLRTPVRIADAGKVTERNVTGWLSHRAEAIERSNAFHALSR